MRKRCVTQVTETSIENAIEKQVLNGLCDMKRYRKCQPCTSAEQSI